MSQPKPATPSAFVLRPSLKLVRPFYTVAFVLAALVFFYNNNREEGRQDWLLIFPALLFIWTIIRQMALRFTSLTVQGPRLRYDQGMLSKRTRTMELSRIQDVQIQQTLMQRMLNIGTISIESAGESGRLYMQNVDNPQAVAEYILDAARSR